jgi:hypothetical protein
MSKYHAKATVVDNIRFHSQKEARRYQELKLLEKAGEIWDLEIQPKFPLRAPSEKTLAGTFPDQVGLYLADFAYRDRTGRVVEDVKSPPTRTALYRWKKRHMKIQYGIEIREV